MLTDDRRSDILVWKQQQSSGASHNGVNEGRDIWVRKTRYEAAAAVATLSTGDFTSNQSCEDSKLTRRGTSTKTLLYSTSPSQRCMSCKSYNLGANQISFSPRRPAGEDRTWDITSAHFESKASWANSEFLIQIILTTWTRVTLQLHFCSGPWASLQHLWAVLLIFLVFLLFFNLNASYKTHQRSPKDRLFLFPDASMTEIQHRAEW